LNKKLFASFIIPLLLISAVSSIYFVYGQPTQVDDEQQVVVEKLLELFTKSNGTLVSAFSVLEARNVTIPTEARENYSRGLVAFAEAIRLRDEMKFQDTKEKILEAMQYMRKAMLILSGYLDEVETHSEKETTKATGIDEAVSRINTTVKRLEDLAKKAEADGLNASRIREKLNLVIDHLINVRNRIRAGNISDADREMNQSKQILGQAMAELNEIKNIHKINQTMHFLNITEKYLTKISELASKLLDKLPITDRAKALAKERIREGLQIGLNKISTLINLTREGKINETLAKLQEIKYDLTEIISQGEAHKPNLSKILEDAHKLEVSINMYEDMAEKLSQRGINVSSATAKIQEARSLALEGAERIKEGDLEKASNLFNQAIDVLNDVKLLIAHLREKG